MHERQVAEATVLQCLSAAVIEFVVFTTPIDKAFVKSADRKEGITTNRDGPALPVLKHTLRCHDRGHGIVAFDPLRISGIEVKQEALQRGRIVSIVVNRSQDFPAITGGSTDIAIVKDEHIAGRQACPDIVRPRFVPAPRDTRLGQMVIHNTRRQFLKKRFRLLINDDTLNDHIGLSKQRP